MTDKSEEAETDDVSTLAGLSYPMARVSVPVWGEACRDCLHIDKDHAVGPPYYMQVNQVWSAGNKEILWSYKFWCSTFPLEMTNCETKVIVISDNDYDDNSLPYIILPSG